MPSIYSNKKPALQPKLNLKQKFKRTQNHKHPKQETQLAKSIRDYLRSKQKRRSRPPGALRWGIPHRIQRRNPCPAIGILRKTRVDIGSSRIFDHTLSLFSPIHIPHQKTQKKVLFFPLSDLKITWTEEEAAEENRDEGSGERKLARKLGFRRRRGWEVCPHCLINLRGLPLGDKGEKRFWKTGFAERRKEETVGGGFYRRAGGGDVAWARGNASVSYMGPLGTFFKVCFDPTRRRGGFG